MKERIKIALGAMGILVTGMLAAWAGAIVGGLVQSSIQRSWDTVAGWQMAGMAGFCAGIVVFGAIICLVYVLLGDKLS